jgi:hypothetical protein
MEKSSPFVCRHLLLRLEMKVMTVHRGHAESTQLWLFLALRTGSVKKNAAGSKISDYQTDHQQQGLPPQRDSLPLSIWQYVAMWA